MLITQNIVYTSMFLTYLSTTFVLCMAKVPQEIAAAFYLMAIELLCSTCLLMMGVPMMEHLINVINAYNAFKITHSPENIHAAYQIEAKKSMLNDAKAVNDAKLEVCTTMKTLLKLEIEKHEMRKQADAESKTISSAASVSNDAINTKCCDEGDSSRSAAVTV